MSNGRYMSLDQDQNQEQDYGYPPQPEYDPAYADQFDENGQFLGDPAQDAPFGGALSEAVNRIQQAKLYETLISAKLFAPGSADPNIIAVVENEMKTFAINKLEELLGMRSPQAAQQHVELPFDEEQIQVLSMLANRALKRSITPSMAPTPTPTLNPIQAPAESRTETSQIAAAYAHTPAVNTIGQAPAPQPQPQRRPAPSRPQAQPQRRPPAQGRRPRTANASEKTGKDLSQAVGRRRKPLAMPPQSTIDSMNANQADSNARGASSITNAAAQSNQPMASAGRSANIGQALANFITEQTK